MILLEISIHPDLVRRFPSHLWDCFFGHRREKAILHIKSWQSWPIHLTSSGSLVDIGFFLAAWRQRRFTSQILFELIKVALFIHVPGIFDTLQVCWRYHLSRHQRTHKIHGFFRKPLWKCLFFEKSGWKCKPLAGHSLGLQVLGPPRPGGMTFKLPRNLQEQIAQSPRPPGLVFSPEADQKAVGLPFFGPHCSNVGANGKQELFHALLLILGWGWKSLRDGMFDDVWFWKSGRYTCWNDAEMMLKWWWNDDEMMMKWCWNNAEMMLKWWWNDAEMMMTWCWNDADADADADDDDDPTCRYHCISSDCPDHLGEQRTKTKYRYIYIYIWVIYMIIYSYVHRYNKPQPCKHLDSQHSDPGRLKGDVSFSLGEEFVRHVDQGLGDITRKRWRGNRCGM